MASMFLDITDRKRGQEELERSEQLYRAMFDTITNGVAVYKAINNGKNFVFVDFNKGAETIEKIDRKDVIGKKVTNVFPGVKKIGLFDVFRKVYFTGKSLSHPIKFYEDNRISGWRENYVYKLPSEEIFAVYEDITEIKRSEEALKLQQAYLERLIESAPEAIVLLDNN
ncbi:PAS domain-containing protein [candidate division KSB1 bacterium]